MERPESQRALVEAWQAYTNDATRFPPEAFTYLFAESAESPGQPLDAAELRPIILRRSAP